MRVISRKVLREFWQKHEDAEQQLKAWFKYASKANWTKPSDITTNDKTAKTLKNGRVRFEICGGSYRLIVKVNYDNKWVLVRFIGTHKEYDKIDANNI